MSKVVALYGDETTGASGHSTTAGDTSVERPRFTFLAVHYNWFNGAKRQHITVSDLLYDDDGKIVSLSGFDDLQGPCGDKLAESLKSSGQKDKTPLVQSGLRNFLNSAAGSLQLLPAWDGSVSKASRRVIPLGDATVSAPLEVTFTEALGRKEHDYADAISDVTLSKDGCTFTFHRLITDPQSRGASKINVNENCAGTICNYAARQLGPIFRDEKSGPGGGKLFGAIIQDLFSRAGSSDGRQSKVEQVEADALEASRCSVETVLQRAASKFLHAASQPSCTLCRRDGANAEGSGGESTYQVKISAFGRTVTVTATSVPSAYVPSA